MVLGRLTRFACRPVLSLSEALGQGGDKMSLVDSTRPAAPVQPKNWLLGIWGGRKTPDIADHTLEREPVQAPTPHPAVPPALPRAGSARAPPGTEGRGYPWQWGKGREGDVGGGSGGPGGAWVGGDITRQAPHSGTSRWGVPPQALLQGVHLLGSRQDGPRTPCPRRAQAGLTLSSGPQLWHFQNGDSSSRPPQAAERCMEEPQLQPPARAPPGPVRAADSLQGPGSCGQAHGLGGTLGDPLPSVWGPWGVAQPK